MSLLRTLAGLALEFLRWTPGILGFLLTAAAAAAAVHLALGDERARIVLFAALLVALALGFPRLHGAVLNKDRVDLIYYGTGIAVATVLYLSKDVERQRLVLSESIARLARQEQDHAAEIRTFEHISANTPSLVAAVHAVLGQQYQALAFERGIACGCAVQAGPLCGDPPIPPSYGAPGYTAFQSEAMTRRLVHAQSCDRLGKQLREAQPDVAATAKDLAGARRLIGVIKRRGSVPVGDTTLPLARAVELAEAAQQDGAAWREAKVREQAALEAQRAAKDTESKALDAAAKRGVVLWAGGLIEFYWPYLLIAFLGMKVARVAYLGGGGGRTRA